MRQLVECVPNFSEGRDRETIDAIGRAITAVSGVKLLDVDPGADTNRTVVTLIGSPEAALEAAFQAIATAAQLIDMTTHRGAHARLGATDVCPFVPVAGMSMEDCVELARRLGKRVGDELEIPVYLYEYAATSEARRNLAVVRQGEYEGLKSKLAQPEWQPDFGPARMNAKSGATMIGAREFLIAYNVNLNTADRAPAHDIALTIREAGRAKRDAAGQIIRDAEGKAIKVPGTLRALKAVGWTIDELDLAQISINLVNYKITPPHIAFEEVRKQARQRGLRVTGSELVGLIPLEAMLAAGRFYLEQQGKSPGVPESDLIRVAVQSLGLSELSPFDPRKKIIEYQFEEDEAKKLVGMTVRGFTDLLSTESPAPGGGSVAALVGGLAAALAAMVANLTVGKKEHEGAWEEMKSVAVEGQELKDFFLAAVDRDTDAFNSLMGAFRLPGKSDADKVAKKAAIEEALKGAIRVPLEVLEKTLPVLALARRAAERGNPNARSDAGVAALAARAAARGAYYNVLINLKSIEDEAWMTKTARAAEDLVGRAEKAASTIEKLVDEHLAIDARAGATP
jgi:glutamate formiminotransferase/formiminotetrahydrofolate cyclodeaminase